MSSHSRSEGTNAVCGTAYLPDMTSPLETRLPEGRPLTGREGLRETGDLQDSKLARFNDEEGREHEANTDGKHSQGSKKQTAKYEQSVPPTHYRYWSAHCRRSMAD